MRWFSWQKSGVASCRWSAVHVLPDGNGRRSLCGVLVPLAGNVFNFSLDENPKSGSLPCLKCERISKKSAELANT